ncbi:MAG: ParB N-terminal domain-containing protein [Bryobacteraceae bacterium]|nr:ParB N-terminal domain-containing protein [Bryobacteraceae bacterium]
MIVGKAVKMGFESQGLRVPVVSILPMKQLKQSVKASQKYQQVLASVREVGIIEPLIVYPQSGTAGIYHLLDGHVRFEVLKQLGATHATCLIATDDEAYTYNKRVSRMATIQEHAMLLKAINSGLSEERIAKTLAVDIALIKQKRQLLQGICSEAAEILKNRHLSPKVFAVMKKMKPMRQIEVAELLVTANNFSVPYAKALLAATASDMLVDPDKQKLLGALTPEQMAKMQKEMEVLQRDLKAIEDSHGNEVLNLVLARGYLAKLFSNVRVVRYLSQNHGDLYRELQAIVDGLSLES